VIEEHTTTVLVVPLRIKIWRQGRTYYAVVVDDAAQHFLNDFIEHEVTLNMNNVKLITKLTRLKQGAGRLAMYLPTRLRPLWEELRSKDPLFAVIMMTSNSEGDINDK
jgi:hypothetical protein